MSSTPRFSKRAAPLLVALVLFGSAIASNRATADATWQRDQFWISGWVSGNESDTARYRKINNADIDLIFGGSTLAKAESVAIVLDTLASAAFDLKAILSYNSPQSSYTFSFNEDPKCNVSEINASLCYAHFKRNSVKGFLVWDEPCVSNVLNCYASSNVMERVDTLSALVNQAACKTERMPYVNLLPFSASCYSAFCGGTAVERYTCYIHSYLDEFTDNGSPAPVLSVDQYPFQTGDSTAIGYLSYFQTLRIMRDEAAEHSRGGARIPMWMVVQLSENTNYGPLVTKEKLRWQVYVALAYGAKGIGYWALSPVVEYSNGLLTTAGDTTTKYTTLRLLNNDLHKLGPTLIKLDAIATYHQDSLGFSGLAADLMSNGNRVYNIVSSISGAGASKGMFGYFKHQDTGADYLMVVNKDTLSAQTITINLTNVADTVYQVSKSTGALVSVGTSTSSFTATSLAAGTGELYKIVDKVDEYIPNINDMLIVGNRTYYAHGKGTVMVNRATGRRTHANDGGVYTPTIDLAVASDTLYLVQHNGVAGNVIRAKNLDLVGPADVLIHDGSSSPSCVAVGPNRIYVGFDGATPSGQTIMAFKRGSLSRVDSVASGSAGTVRDIEYQTGLSNMAVLNDERVRRYNDDLDSGPSKTITDGKELALDSSGEVFVASDDGSTGKLRQTNAAVDAFVSGYSAPSGRMVFSAVNPGNTRVVAAVVSGSGGDFKWYSGSTGNLEDTALSVSSPPRCVMVAAGDTCYLATSTGMRKYVDFIGDVARRYAQVGPTHEPLRFAVRPNPVRSEAAIDLVLPRAAVARLAVYDVQGREVDRIVSRRMTAGTHAIAWSTRGIRPGIYFLRLRVGAEVVSRRIVISS